MNYVMLFSNGIGHFTRTYKVGNEKKNISIAFNRGHIGDVASSLQVFGKVKLDSPPTFTPGTSTITALKIDPNDSLKSLLSQLSGAKIKKQGKSYTLIGLIDEIENSAACQPAMLLMDKEGDIHSVRFAGSLTFEEETVNAEIQKALKNNFQSIKPDSLLLDLTLSSKQEEEVEATVQYTIPVAAWKMRYAIREDKGGFRLEGAAVIDNNTDEDWTNFKLSVVTGNPISFATDIANVVVPERKFVNLVDKVSIGSASACRGLRAAASNNNQTIGSKMSVANYASFGLNSVTAEMCSLEAAESVEVESKDVGDFCVFTAKEPVTLFSKKSAIVPMFTADLNHAGILLHYKEENHPTRPYRAVKFRNETQYSLGRGKTVIYNEGVFSGECVLDATKPGETRVLPHCLENGVKVTKGQLVEKRSCCRLNVAKGKFVEEIKIVHETEYTIINRKSENFKMAVEHDYTLSDPVCEIDGYETEKTDSGVRTYFELDTLSTLSFMVVETARINRECGCNHFLSWMKSVDSVELSSNEIVKSCLSLESENERLRTVEAELSQDIDKLSLKAERLRKNIGAIKDISGQDTSVLAWIKSLDDTENEISRLEADIKATKSEEAANRQKVQTLLNNLALNIEF